MVRRYLLIGEKATEGLLRLSSHIKKKWFNKWMKCMVSKNILNKRKIKVRQTLSCVLRK